MQEALNEKVLTPLGQKCLQSLLLIWLDFERQLGQVPVIARLEQGRLSREDYQRLLMNLRQQVIEGSRWITRCASSLDRDYADVRSMVIHHASDEHRDYEMLERDYVAAGGVAEAIRAGTRNIGSEALHGFMMYRSGQPNPVDMIGAMWIIEGLGNKMASSWAERVEQSLGGTSAGADMPTRFMRYHGEHDEAHLEELYELIDRVCESEEQHAAIVRTARVVARLYLLQLEEVDHEQA